MSDYDFKQPEKKNSNGVSRRLVALQPCLLILSAESGLTGSFRN
jgi:hypothetical protein